MRRLILPALAAALTFTASPALAADPHLVKLEYGQLTSRSVQSYPFHTAGSYREIDVVDAIAVRTSDGRCKAFSLRLIAVASGHTVGPVKRFGCKGSPFHEAHWTGLKNGWYAVKQTVAKPVRGEVYGLTGTVVHGVAP